jgi:hypothetical protein
LAGAWLWAQAQGAPLDSEAAVVARSALARWFGGLTLSSPDPVPDKTALWALLAGLGALFLLALLIQGPLRAIGQLFDLPGHLRVVMASLRRFRRAGRLVAVLLGATVFSWTTWQARLHAEARRLEELIILRKAKSIGEIAFEQGVLAGLTPLRDLLGLGDTLFLLIVAAMVVFKRSADRWSVTAPREVGDRLPSWTTLTWCCTWLYLLYRLAGVIWEPTGQPIPLSLGIEIGLVPLVQVVSDALLFAWVLTEARHAFSDAADEQIGLQVGDSVRRLPAAVLVCVLVLPARWLAVTARLALPYASGELADVALRPVLLGWGLVWLQAAALPLLPLAGAAAWGSDRRGTLRVYLQMLRAAGGRLVAVVAGSALASGLLAGLAYQVILRLPPQSWVLLAADSYAHYATLPVGLLLVVTLVEIADLSSRTQVEEHGEPLEAGESADNTDAASSPAASASG